MSLPVAAKIGTGATLAIGAPTSIYLTWDHITLYAVEREVINTRDLKLTVTGPASGENKIVIEAAKFDGSETTKLPSGFSWSCEITVDPAGISDSGLAGKIQKNLPKEGEITDKKVSNKILLVKACSKRRKPGYNSNEVTGLLNVKRKEHSNPVNFYFENYSYLDFLLS